MQGKHKCYIRSGTYTIVVHKHHNVFHVYGTKISWSWTIWVGEPPQCWAEHHPGLYIGSADTGQKIARLFVVAGGADDDTIRSTFGGCTDEGRIAGHLQPFVGPVFHAMSDLGAHQRQRARSNFPTSGDGAT